jgi:hypothetical protein
MASSGYLPEWASRCRLLQGATVSSRVGLRRFSTFPLGVGGPPRRHGRLQPRRFKFRRRPEGTVRHSTCTFWANFHQPHVASGSLKSTVRVGIFFYFRKIPRCAETVASLAATCLLSGSDGLRIPGFISFFKKVSGRCRQVPASSAFHLLTGSQLND